MKNVPDCLYMMKTVPACLYMIKTVPDCLYIMKTVPDSQNLTESIDDGAGSAEARGGVAISLLEIHELFQPLGSPLPTALCNTFHELFQLFGLPLPTAISNMFSSATFYPFLLSSDRFSSRTLLTTTLFT